MIKHLLNNKDGVFAIGYREGGKRGAPMQTFEVSQDVYVNVPETLDEARDFFASFSTEVGGESLKGVEAALARFALHCAESVRATFRTALEKGEVVTEEMVASGFEDWDGPNGRRGGFKRPEASQNELARITAIEDVAERAAALTAYMARIGVGVK
jgi:hypothetical protein